MISDKSLALSRIGFGIILTLDVLVRSTDCELHYSGKGILPIEAMLDLGNTTMFSFHFIHSSLLYQRILLLLQIIFSISFLLGFKTKKSNFLCWIFLISIHNRNILILNSGDDLLRLLLFWSLFLPLGNKYSIDSIFHKQKEKPIQLAYFAFKFQIAWMYIETYLLKTGPLWKSGMSAIHALSDIQFTTYFGIFLLNNSPDWFLIFSSHFTLLIEIILPILILLSNISIGPKWIQKSSEIICFFSIFGVFSLHFSFALCMEIGFFPFIPIVGSLILIPASFWKYGENRKKNRKQSTTIEITISKSYFWESLIIIVGNFFNFKPKFVDNIEINNIKNTDLRYFFVITKDKQEKHDLISFILYWLKIKRINSCIFIFVFQLCFMVTPLGIIFWIFFPTHFLLLLPIVITFQLFITLLEMINLGVKFKNFCLFVILFFYSFVFYLLNMEIVENPGNYFHNCKKILVTIALIYIILLVTQKHFEYDVPGWEKIEWIGATLRFDQYWGMFAPDPPLHTGYWMLPAVIKHQNGSILKPDLLANHFSQLPIQNQEYFGFLSSSKLPFESLNLGNSVDTQLLDLPSSGYKGQRWRKYFMNVKLEVFQPFAEYYLDFLCSHWNERVTDEYQLIKISLEYNSTLITSPYTRNLTESSEIFRFGSLVC